MEVFLLLQSFTDHVRIPHTFYEVPLLLMAKNMPPIVFRILGIKNKPEY